jgi:hypothetical protein
MMENFLMEFVEACVHQIIYHRGLYPDSIFVKRLLVPTFNSIKQFKSRILKIQFPLI